MIATHGMPCGEHHAKKDVQIQNQQSTSSFQLQMHQALQENFANPLVKNALHDFASSGDSQVSIGKHDGMEMLHSLERIA